MLNIGKNATSAIATKSTRMNGRAHLVMPPTSRPVIDCATKRLDATGGVTNAMQSERVMTRPNWIGWIPSGVTICRRIGETMMIVGVVWTNIPTINRIAKIISMMTKVLSEMPKKKFCTFSPNPRYTNTELRAPAVAIV